MGSHLTYIFLLIFFILHNVSAVKTCNVLNFGAVANNKTDIGPAMMRAFECAQKSITNRASDTVLLVPAGNYRWASQVSFAKSKFITVTIHGYLYLPYDPKLQGNMMLFSHCNNIIFNGKGRLYGNGDNFRPGRDLKLNPKRPRLIRFDQCDTVDYSGVDLYDAPMFHLVVSLGKNIRIHHFEIHCLNIGATDGINVSGSDIYVHDVVVENGDECVTAKSPMVGLKVRNVQCVGTTGCAIGSMGDSAKGYRIENLDYRNVTVRHGANGVVIKSYPGASGIIRNVSYSQFQLTNVAYPIKLDYTWGATLHKTGRQKRGEAIQTWSGLTFNEFSGTGNKNRAPVTLNCPGRSPCTGIQFNNIRLTGSNKPTVISNACGKADSTSRKNIPNLPAC
ncbi:family 28 glycoside hydrolase [Melampsora americana]|nr:family 28 glycoside hydrolase [Melampsora americana]